VLGRYSVGAPAESEWERKVYDALSGRGVGGMIRQFKVRLPGYGPARFDVAIPDIRWALEVDVHPEHRTVEGVARDNQRDDAADSIGWFVKRIAEAQLTDHFEFTMDAVIASIERRRTLGGER
jgi:very-short-patch-repair endonuclease